MHKKRDANATIIVIIIGTVAITMLMVCSLLILKTSESEREASGDTFSIDGKYRLHAEDYLGEICYVSVSLDEGKMLKTSEDFANTELWSVPTYNPTAATKTFVKSEITIPHKTKVHVKRDQPKYCYARSNYHHLLVEDATSGEQYYIKPKNLVAVPYWQAEESLQDGAGYCIAEYHPVSDHLPVSAGKMEVSIEAGTYVLITGNIYDGLDNTSKTNPVEGWIWKEWEYSGYKAAPVYFNEEDLRIVY